MPKHFDHEIVFDDVSMEDKPFKMPNGKNVYAYCRVVVGFNAHSDSCDYPNDTRETWVEVSDWEATVELSDCEVYDEDGEVVEPTDEMREHFQQAYHPSESHFQDMVEMAKSDD